jgi:CBS domain-containing protein
MAQERKHARDVMTRNPDCVSERDSIRDVARIMKDTDTGIVPVVEGKKIVGLITDRDIVVRGLADGKDLTTASVGDVMTRQVKSVREETPVDEVLNVMTSAEIRRVTVVNANNELVGIVSIGDISKHTRQDNQVGKAIEDISQAPPNN